MKFSNVAWIGIVLVGLVACSSSDGGSPVVQQTDSIAVPNNTLSKTEEDLVASGQVEQNVVDTEAPKETF